MSSALALKAQYGQHSSYVPESDQNSPELPVLTVKLQPGADGSYSESLAALQAFMGDRGVYNGPYDRKGNEVAGVAQIGLRDITLNFDGQSFIAVEPPAPVTRPKRPFREFVDHSTDPGLESEWTFHRQRLGLEL